MIHPKITEELARREIAAITMRWADIRAKEFARHRDNWGQSYRLVIHPDLWEAIGRQYPQYSADTLDIRRFIGMDVLLDEHVEGWLILELGEFLGRHKCVSLKS